MDCLQDLSSSSAFFLSQCHAVNYCGYLSTEKKSKVAYNVSHKKTIWLYQSDFQIYDKCHT